MNTTAAVAANAVSAYSNHSYYRGDHSLSSAAAAAAAGHSVSANWPSIGANGKFSHHIPPIGYSQRC